MMYFPIWIAMIIASTIMTAIWATLAGSKGLNFEFAIVLGGAASIAYSLTIGLASHLAWAITKSSKPTGRALAATIPTATVGVMAIGYVYVQGTRGTPRNALQMPMTIVTAVIACLLIFALYRMLSGRPRTSNRE